ncbi:MAG: hypothetical protein IJX25_03110 [Clostridia bacterium]|nr:hypothetical protein [Clostridia bacterium]
MEKYIEKINERLLRKNDLEKATKIKKRFCIVGGIILGIGAIGILSSVIAFVVYFLRSDTETAFTAWLIAIPFIIVLVAGAVVTRVGDQLLKKHKPAQIKREDTLSQTPSDED